MKHTTLGWIIGALVTAAPIGLAASWLGAGCSQGSIDCRGAPGSFAVRYTQVGGDPGCGGLTTGFVGLETYYGATSEAKIDYSRITLAVQSEVLGYLMWTSQEWGVVDEANKPYGLGAFSTAEPSGDVCTVPTLALAEQDIVEIPGEGGAGGAAGGAGGAGGAAGGAGGGTAGAAGAPCPEPPPPGPYPGQPATDIQFQWSNVKVYVTPAAEGTQFVADLNYSENIGGVSCSAQYKVIGVWPVIDCGEYTYDDCGELVDAVPVDRVCKRQATDPDTPVGSVLMNPDYNVSCDPDLFVCVANAPVPELQ